jgi:hypothetical protein
MLIVRVWKWLGNERRSGRRPSRSGRLLLRVVALGIGVRLRRVYDTAPSVLPLEATSRTVPIEELTRSSSPASMLPAALSEALGISLADVMMRYFDGSEESVRVRWIEEALDRRREFEEGEEWLTRESHRTDTMLERIHRGQDDALF